MIYYNSENPPTQELYSIGNYVQFIYYLPDTPTKIWYENRDSDHANFSRFFQNEIQKSVSNNITIERGISLVSKYRNGIVIANSSTASNPDETNGSNTRFLDLSPIYYNIIRDSWKKGYLQFFPEHRDYDDRDWFKANQPYAITTQGSSNSESDEMQRCNDMLNTINPEVREWMIANQRVGDVVAYLMRSNLPGGYLDPKNHRPVVTTGLATPEDLALAASITLETMPPTLSIKLISDSINQEYPNYKVQTSEVIGLKRSDLTHLRVIEVELVSDKPNVTFVWKLLQGKAEIDFKGTDISKAILTIPWQSNFEVEAQDGHKLISNRMDVMAVAHDGTHYSCPVFISEYTTPEARELKPRMNEIGIAADNSFICKLNGVEVSTGDNWQALIRKPVEWKEGNNIVEIAVTNAGGPGGLLASFFVGEVETITDDSWEVSTDQLTWKKPDKITPYGQGAWGSGVPGVKAGTLAKWLWLAEAPEVSTVYFRKTVVVGTPVPNPTPEPEPNPSPDQSAEIERLKAELDLEKRNYISLNEMYNTKVSECESVLSRYKDSIRKLSDLKNALNEVLK